MKERGGNMTSYFVPIRCRTCQHLFEGRGINKDGRWTCKAFMGGIPDVMYYTDEKHLKPLPGQKNDIVFELIKKEGNK